MPTEQLINELQSFGVRLADPRAGAESRRGGAGPSDHKAVTIDGVTVMVPVHTAPAFDSPYRRREARRRRAQPHHAATASAIGEVSFPERPRFYELQTADGIPYSKIAMLHGRDVLATTVLQTCIRYQSRTQDLPVLRHRPVARGRPHHRAQDARATRRGRARGRRARRREAHGDDHRHAARPRPRRGHPRESAARRQGRGRPADPGAVRAARRRRLVRAHAGRRRRRARHASRGGDARACARASCRARRRSRSSAISRPSRRRCRCSAAARSRPTSSPASATPRRRSSTICERLVALGVYPVRRAVRADRRHAARKPSGAVARVHARHPGAARARCSSRAGCSATRHQGRLRQVRRLLGALDLRAEARVMIFEPFEPFHAPASSGSSSPTDGWEREGAYALRRQVFCDEQGIVRGDDRDAVDDYAIPLVALSLLGVAADEVVGTVRIHEDEPGLWWGSRLAVAARVSPHRRGRRDADPARRVVGACAAAAGRFSRMCRARTRRCSSRCTGSTIGGGRAARPAASSDAGRSRLLSAVPHAGDRLTSRCRKAA